MKRLRKQIPIFNPPTFLKKFTLKSQFFSKLSQDYIESTLSIEVGEDPIFRVHMSILCYRSPYLRRTLASNKKNNDILAHIKLPNIPPEVFQIILR